jgi:ParB-like chromosome segregation protein Spo0J
LRIIRFQIDDDRAFDLALVENIQRQSLNAMEEAKAFRVLSKRGMTQVAVCKLIANPALQV